MATDMQSLTAKLDRLLPPRYQHCVDQTPTKSMGSAGLKYGPDGRVKWGEIWTNFCDLALAGGPPHRGRLLQAVRRADALADPAATRATFDELSRAIPLAALLEVVDVGEPGWAGVVCLSTNMAAWLQRAVVAENVSARRDGTTLLVPSGPAFRVEREVKNVVVALAKTIHYWDSHLTPQQQALGDVVWEPATLDEIEIRPGEYAAALAVVGQAEHTPGWAGVPCRDEEQAAWLLRAVVVEDVLARRERATLCVAVGVDPAGATATIAALADARRLWASVEAGP